MVCDNLVRKTSHNCSVFSRSQVIPMISKFQCDSLTSSWNLLSLFTRHSNTKVSNRSFDKQFIIHSRNIFNSHIISHFDMKICVHCRITYQGPRGYLENAIELRNLRALLYSTLYEIVSFNVWVRYYVWNLISVLHKSGLILGISQGWF